MASTLYLTGNLVTAPLEGGSGNSIIPFPLEEVVALSKRYYDEITLADNTVTTVSFGGLSEVNVVCMRVTGGKARLRVTTSDGSQQSIPLDPLGLFISKSVPITALDVMRDNTITNEVSIRVFLGQKQ